MLLKKKLATILVLSIVFTIFTGVNSNAVEATSIKTNTLDTASEKIFVCDWDAEVTECIECINTNMKEYQSKSHFDECFWIGDSRTIGMNMFQNIDYLAEVGCGIQFFYDNEEQIYSLSNKNILINLGVNDLDYLQKYINLYNSLPEAFVNNNNIYVVSVNPCEGSYSYLNDRIENFNQSIKDTLPETISYIDTYSYLIQNGFSTSDGLHYTGDTYLDIYSFVMRESK